MIPDIIENTGRTITGQLAGFAVLHYVLGVPVLGSIAGVAIMFAVSWVKRLAVAAGGSAGGSGLAVHPFGHPRLVLGLAHPAEEHHPRADVQTMPPAVIARLVVGEVPARNANDCH
jgi:hypothetical protein